MVNMKEIMGIVWDIFAPFVGKAMIVVIILGVLGLLIDIAVHKIRNKKK